MRKRSIKKVVGATAVMCGVLALAIASSSASATVNVNVGFVDSETGQYSACGVEQTNAAKLWVKQFDASQSKYDLHVIVADDQSTASGTLSAVEKLLGDHVSAIFGECLTENADATVGPLTKSGIPVVFDTASSLPGRGPNLFSLAPPEKQLYTFASRTVFKRTHAKTASIITLDSTTQDAALPGVTSTAKAMGVKLLSNQTLATTTTNFQSEVINALKGNPDVVVVLSVPASTGSIIKELRQEGYKGAIMTAESADQASTFSTAGAALGGSYVPTFWDSSLAKTSKASEHFVKSYEHAYKGQPVPDVYGSQAWDSAIVVTDAIEKAGTKPSALVKAIQTGTFSGVEGSALTFSNNGFAHLSNSLILMNKKGVGSVVAGG